MIWCSGCASLPPSGAVVRPSQQLISPGLLPIRTVVVDAGHGGHDPGTQHHGLREKDLALDIVRRLQVQLKAAGLAVVLTRDRDEFIALSRRAGIANRLPADLFVSVHINANRKRSIRGVEVYYPRESVIDPTVALPPRVQPAEVALPTTTITYILWDLVLARARRQSARVASHICRTLRERLEARCRGVHGARFVVLREAWMPAVLVEVGYLSNRQEASRLASPSYRQTIAQAIAEGITAYIRELNQESRSSS